MHTTASTPPTHRPLRRLLIALLGAVVALVALAPGSPAGAIAPGAPRIIGTVAYDQPGPNGYHKIDWTLPTTPKGKPVDGYEIERWNADLSQKLATVGQLDEVGATRYFNNLPDDVVFRYRVRAHNVDGWSAWSDWEGARIFVGSTHLQPYSNAAEFIQRHFKDFTGKAATPAQLAFWLTNVDTTEEVVAFIDHFAGYASRIPRPQVIRLYKAYFQRAPEPGGLAYWANEMALGKTSMTKMSEFFAKSPEFKTLYGDKTNAQFVTLVYQNVLDRDPSVSDMAYWKGQLDQGKISRGKLMIGFSESPENKALVKGEVVTIDMWTTIMREVPGGNEPIYAGHVDGGGTGGDIALMLFPLNGYPLG